MCGEVVQCAGCRALCQCLVCGQFCLVCSYCGQLCRVLPNDFLRTQTRGMLPWRSPAPFSHAPSTMSACTKATGCHTGQWNNPNLLPGCPIDCHPATTAVPTLLPNILSAQLDSAPSFTVGSHGIKVGRAACSSYPRSPRWAAAAHRCPSAHPFSRSPSFGHSQLSPHFTFLSCCKIPFIL